MTLGNGGNSIKPFFKTISIPIALAILNVAAQYLYVLLPNPAGTAVFNITRIALWTWAGWRIVSFGIGSLWHAGWAGAVLFFIDHVILRGGMFLVMTVLGKVTVKFGLMSFGGVIVSYLMFGWIAFLLGVLGGYLGRRIHQGPQAAT